MIRALRSNGIEVTAIHSHMLTEKPRIFFMHFWANDDAIKLAKGLRAALDKTASARAEIALKIGGGLLRCGARVHPIWRSTNDTQRLICRLNASRHHHRSASRTDGGTPKMKTAK